MSAAFPFLSSTDQLFLRKAKRGDVGRTDASSQKKVLRMIVYVGVSVSITIVYVHAIPDLPSASCLLSNPGQF